jgi:hypothetical protein
MFGVQGKPTEMGIIVIAGAISLAFLNIDKIQRFKGAGFEAEMKKTIEEANATIEQLRNVAATSAETTLTTLMADSFFDGTTLETRLSLHDRLISNLEEIGVSKAQIENSDAMWKRGVGIIYHRGIGALLKGITSKQVLDEFQVLLKFEDWKAPSSNDMRQFIEQKGLMKPEIDELLNDYREFEKTGILRRRDVFVKL